MSENEILSDLLIGVCNCGKVTTFKCHELWSANTLTPCPNALCSLGCTAHRHAPGTMGYVGWVGATDYKGDAPDGPGFIQWLKSRMRFWFWSPHHKAQAVWDEKLKNFPPPAPFPNFRLTVEGVVFESRGDLMVEIGEETDPLDEEAKT